MTRSEGFVDTMAKPAIVETRIILSRGSDGSVTVRLDDEPLRMPAVEVALDPAEAAVIDAVEAADATAEMIAEDLAGFDDGLVVGILDELVSSGMVRRWTYSGSSAGCHSMKGAVLHRLTTAGRKARADFLGEPARPGLPGAGQNQAIVPDQAFVEHRAVVPDKVTEQTQSQTIATTTGTTPKDGVEGAPSMIGPAAFIARVLATIARIGPSNCVEVVIAMDLTSMKPNSARTTVNTALCRLVDTQKLERNKQMNGKHPGPWCYIYSLPSSSLQEKSLADTSLVDTSLIEKTTSPTAPTRIAGAPSLAAAPMTTPQRTPLRTTTAPRQAVRVQAAPVTEPRGGGASGYAKIAAAVAQAKTTQVERLVFTKPALSLEERALRDTDPLAHFKSPPRELAQTPATSEVALPEIRRVKDLLNTMEPCTAAEIAAAMAPTGDRKRAAAVAELLERLHREGEVWARREPATREGPGTIVYSLKR